jgi:hypothetical protein
MTIAEIAPIADSVGESGLLLPQDRRLGHRTPRRSDRDARAGTASAERDGARPIRCGKSAAVAHRVIPRPLLQHAAQPTCPSASGFSIVRSPRWPGRLLAAGAPPRAADTTAVRILPQSPLLATSRREPVSKMRLTPRCACS